MDLGRITVRICTDLPKPATVDALVRAAERHQRSSWRRELERCITGMGLRAELIHVDESTWARMQARGVAPADAVVEVADLFN